MQRVYDIFLIPTLKCLGTFKNSVDSFQRKCAVNKFKFTQYKAFFQTFMLQSVLLLALRSIDLIILYCLDGRISSVWPNILLQKK